MFQRQVKQKFPARNIIVFAALVLCALLYIASKLGGDVERDAESPGEHEEATEKKHSGLEPNEWHQIMREYPDFKPDIQVYQNAIEEANNSVALRGQFKGFEAPWNLEGPGNIGARINSIKVHPTNHNIIYAGYARGGVWKTTDGGLNWAPIFDKQNYLSIGDIELDPVNPNIVYVGTGDPSISIHPGIGDGLWKSTDGGASWTHLGLADKYIITKIIVHPNNPNTLYVAAMGLPFERDNNRGVYKSINGGQSWQQVLFVSDQAGAIDMEMLASDPETLFAASWDRIRNNHESLVSGTNSKIWKTTNGGANWTALGSANGLPDGPVSRIGLSAVAANPDYIYSVVVDTTLNIKGMYQSADKGNNWSELSTDGLDLGFMGGFGWYFGKIFVNPYNVNDLFVLGVELWRSTDGGGSWFQATPPWWTYEVHADAHDMAFVDLNTFLLATDGGLYRTEDDGGLWQKIENIPCNEFYRVAYNPHFPDFYYGGLQDNGTTAGNSAFINDWPRLLGGDGFGPAFHPTDPNIIYYETQNGGIYGTTDGSFFDNATSGIDPTDRRDWDMPYLISPNDPNYMYTGTYRVYQSFGHPASWFPISEDLTDGNIFGERYHIISTVQESPLSAELLYVGTTDANVWRGNPMAGTWVNITGNLPERFVSAVRPSPNNQDRVFVTHTGYKDNDHNAHIHRSDNQGSSWTDISGDLPNLAINDLLVMPGHQDSVLFVATDAGVFGSLNGGTHWEKLGDKMPSIQVFSLGLNVEKKTLFAGTFGRSLYSFPLDSISGGGDVSIFTPGGAAAPKLTVTPNPAVDHGKVIVENLKLRQETQVILVDLSGRTVWQANFSGAQKHEKELDVANLPAGVYVAYAKTEGRVWGQQKIVIAR